MYEANKNLFKVKGFVDSRSLMRFRGLFVNIISKYFEQNTNKNAPMCAKDK